MGLLLYMPHSCKANRPTEARNGPVLTVRLEQCHAFILICIFCVIDPNLAGCELSTGDMFSDVFGTSTPSGTYFGAAATVTEGLYLVGDSGDPSNILLCS